MIILLVKIAKKTNKKTQQLGKNPSLSRKHFYIHIIAVWDEEKNLRKQYDIICVVRSGKLQISKQKQEIKKKLKSKKKQDKLCKRCDSSISGSW